MHYAVLVDGEWLLQVVDPDGGYLPIISLDEQGEPAIAYRWGPSRYVPHAWRVGGIRVARRDVRDGIDQDCDGSDG